MRPRDRKLAKQLIALLKSFEKSKYSLPGIQNPANCAAFIEQLLESIHRIDYISKILNRDISPLRADPSSEFFDPLKAAILYHRQGNIEESFWLVFLSVHFGKHFKDGWRLTQDVYGQMSGKSHWNWKNTSAHPQAFRKWLATHQNQLKTDGIPRRFGNHRKYESLDGWSNAGTGEVVESYIKWVNPPRTHLELVQEASGKAGRNPRTLFDCLYHSMQAVHRFGRTARFDYLTMIGKLGLARIEPGSTYMQGATGPLIGARLLFGGSKKSDLSRSDLDNRLVELGDYLNVGMQVMEDALCNWQKSPNAFRRFRG